MKIYGDVRSGNCDKVRFTVDYLRSPYEWVEIDSVAGATRTPEFLAINSQGQVPVVQLAGLGHAHKARPQADGISLTSLAVLHRLINNA
jgi:glutathione S-transferase